MHNTEMACLASNRSIVASCCSPCVISFFELVNPKLGLEQLSAFNKHQGLSITAYGSVVAQRWFEGIWGMDKTFLQKAKVWYCMFGYWDFVSWERIEYLAHTLNYKEWVSSRNCLLCVPTWLQVPFRGTRSFTPRFAGINVTIKSERKYF